ncbi:MAG: CapA family protein [Clostridia bacterium]|nr:CapA family protein [Clostridia bacterium]
MKFTAVGDMLIQRRIQADFEGFAELGPFIKQGDASFFNLETTLNREAEACASQFSGGTYLRADPKVLGDIKSFGFNMTTFNNNHALDFFYTGFESTLKALDDSGMVHAGAGRNLGEASAPRYLETSNGRVALISVSLSFSPSMMAGEQTPRIPGRPGINGIRIETHVELPAEEFEHIKRIADITHINVAKEISRQEGYSIPLEENVCELGDLRFILGDTPRVVMSAPEKDIHRVMRAIREAQLQADYIIISVHSHQLSGTDRENPSEFLKDFAHRCIDAGAHAIVGHGPHLLRPIEIYKDCPIFYSLGDFVLQLYNIEVAPEEFYTRFGLPFTSTVRKLLQTRSKNFTVGLMTDLRMFLSVIPCWETEGTKLKKLTLMPIEMKMTGHKSEIGLPRRSYDPNIAAYLAEMCEPYGTKISFGEDGLITCEW